MFDLRFISVVKKVLAWTEPAPPCRFANAHESSLQQKRMRYQLEEVTGTMSINEMTLHVYVSNTYPVYFGLHGCRAGQGFERNYHSLSMEY